MSAVCQSCLGDVEDGARYHARCLKQLFGVPHLPTVDVEVAKLHTLALAMVDHTTLTGAQKKLSLRLDGTAFILKPPAETFPALVQNEHLSMRLAREVGIQTPPNALVPMKDGQIAYLVKRFDRTEHGKLHQEDFCQLNRKSPKERYVGSAEQCAQTVRRFATEPIVEARKLFRYVVFSWWIGNGDLHLKNLSLLRSPDGFWRLAPAYDLLSTALVIPGDQLALSVAGTKEIRSRKRWAAFASACGLPDRAAERVLDEISGATDDCIALIGRSSLPADQQRGLRDVLAERSGVLRGEPTGPEPDERDDIPVGSTRG